MVGIVPVKVRGTCKAGDIIVPSGKEDGTAKAAGTSGLSISTYYTNRCVERNLSWPSSANDFVPAFVWFAFI